MKGCSRRAKSDYDHAIFTAWHTAVFAIRAYSGKLANLDKYLKGKEVAPPKAQTPDEMLAALLTMQARGTPMNIKKLH